MMRWGMLIGGLSRALGIWREDGGDRRVEGIGA